MQALDKLVHFYVQSLNSGLFKGVRKQAPWLLISSFTQLCIGNLRAYEVHGSDKKS